MGCAASLIGFNSVLEAISAVKNENVNALLISIELCSIHLQTEPSRDNILANMIFADGCAAAYFTNKSSEAGKLELISTNSVLFPDSTEYMGWKIGNCGFEMTLSSELPKIIENSAVPELINILDSYKIKADQIQYWALHPGGRAILDAIEKGLTLPPDKMKPSREILRKYGNMSSASILFVIKEILDTCDIAKDEYCCAVAFGPGLTMETALLRGV
jgi:predicted naringenin-chalcone synthase